MMSQSNHPHSTARVYGAGAPIDQARAALILIHGRGSSAQNILGLAEGMPLNDIAVIAPNAVGQTWYPQRFIRPVAENEPYLSSALGLIKQLVMHLNEAGIPTDKIIIGGFSQGACLASEYVAQNPARYGGLAVFSGGLIGESVARENYPAETDLAGTPVFIGCSDVDFHIPVERVHETTAILRELGGNVTERIYENMEHTINDDELTFFVQMVQTL